MTAEDYIIKAICKTSCTVLTLKYEVLEKFREKFDSLDKKLIEYEKYIEENGLPYCDYKLYRSPEDMATPIQKFQQGIKRIIRIVKAYKTNKITDLLNVVQAKVKSEKKDRLRRKQKQLLNSLPNSEERMQELLLHMSEQMRLMNSKIDSLTHQLNAKQNTCN